MTWFLVVVMMGQPNGITPLYVTYKTFEEQDKCIQFAQTNQRVLFQKAITQYEGKIPPQLITCVTEDAMKTIFDESLEYGNPRKEKLDEKNT